MPWSLARKEDGLAYELEALETGRRLGLHASDWDNLVGLAHRYGWRPEAGLDRYLRGGRRTVPSSDARALAEALEGALRDLPPERRKELRSYVGESGGGPPRPGAPDADHVGYFSWQRRWIVEEAIGLCRLGAVEVRPM